MLTDIDPYIICGANMTVSKECKLRRHYETKYKMKNLNAAQKQ